MQQGIANGWCPAGARLVPGWCPVGARLVPGWCPVGARLVSGCSRLVVENAIAQLMYERSPTIVYVLASFMLS